MIYNFYFGHDFTDLIGNETIFHKILRKFANKYPQKYESRLSHILPLNSLKFTLEVIK